MVKIPPDIIHQDLNLKTDWEGGGLTNHASTHLDGGSDPITGLKRSQLEYPTEDVSFAYLAAIDKLKFDHTHHTFWEPEIYVTTVDSFTDKAIQDQKSDRSHINVRIVDYSNLYNFTLDSSKATADFLIHRLVADVQTDIASEAVDINTDSVYGIKASISGSTLKGYRDDFVTPKFTVTDTSHASGLFGSGLYDAGGHGGYPGQARLLAASSPAQMQHAIIEYAVIGSGKEDDPLRPDMQLDLVEILNTNISNPKLLKEAKRYEILKNKGFTDEEIEALLGYIPKHQINTLAVNWGAYDYKEENTIITTVRGNQVLEHKEYAKTKNLKAFTVKDDKTYIEDIFKEIRAGRSEMIAGKHNFAYQVLGYEELELLAIADFYDGFNQGTYNMKDLERVPEWELERTINRWMNKLEKAKVTSEEKEKHQVKLKTILKR